VLNGKYGPYIVVGKKNVKIPKGKEPASLTLAECLALAAETPDKPGRAAPAEKKAPVAKATVPKKTAATTKKTTASKTAKTTGTAKSKSAGVKK
jgi:DNA topoisomerase-1